jgi:site-specific recombinase XerD
MSAKWAKRRSLSPIAIFMITRPRALPAAGSALALPAIVKASPYVFTSERGGPMSAKSFGTLFERLGRRAGMPFTIFPHMLRHACGYALANAGHDTRALQAWLGHKNIQHTVRYTELAPNRFKDFWR